MAKKAKISLEKLYKDMLYIKSLQKKFKEQLLIAEENDILEEITPEGCYKLQVLDYMKDIIQPEAFYKRFKKEAFDFLKVNVSSARKALGEKALTSLISEKKPVHSVQVTFKEV